MGPRSVISQTFNSTSDPIYWYSLAVLVAFEVLSAFHSRNYAMSSKQEISIVNDLRKADKFKKDLDTGDSRPHGLGWGPRGMRKGGWTGYGVYWGK
jgi:hypothetical protein